MPKLTHPDIPFDLESQPGRIIVTHANGAQAPASITDYLLMLTYIKAQESESPEPAPRVATSKVKAS